MIKGVGLIISIEDLQNYDYKKIEKLLKDKIINDVQKEVEESDLNIYCELDEIKGKTVLKVGTKFIIDFNNK